MMKIFSARMILVLLSLQAMLLSQASAHPGPEGHTHPDEWPFEMLAYVAMGLGLGWIFRRMWKKN